MADRMFDIDSRTKLGSDTAWEEGDDFSAFVDALNRGLTVRSDRIPSETGAPADIRDDALALSELRALFANYR